MSDVLGTETAVEVAAGDISLRFATGQLAKQADGAVLVQSGDTVVLSTVVGAQEARPGADFFPLTVDVEEKMYAAGKIPGGFFKREGRATEKATLNARMIDRPIRPLFPKGFRNEVQVIGTVLSVDKITSHDILAMNGASAALMISPLPFAGPVGAVRVGLIEGELRVNPSMPDMLESDLDLIVCGTPEAITMVEAGANIVPEDRMVEALELAHETIKGICAAQIELQQQVGKPKWYDAGVDRELDERYGASFDRQIAEHGIAGVEQAAAEALAAECPPVAADAGEDVMVRRTQVKFALGFISDRRRAAAVKAPVQEQFEADIRALSDAEQDSKELKSAKRAALIERIVQEIRLPFPGGADSGLDAATQAAVRSAVDSVYKQIVRTKIAVDKRRPDGRGENEIRPIAVAAGVMPRTHGSALFTRGQTQALTLVTLGTIKEEQRIDDLSLETTKRYIHHYNFPPFSVGETGFMRGPKRRDIGHGALAERALVAVVPAADEFAYTMRAVSEILESNGSSSMASVCGSTLALMDAGVPIKAPVAGIAMGLIKEGESLVILTDIQGAEDHLGDMDFKVAGTAEGITALQMDIKITGVTRELLKDALDRAKAARLSILSTMATALAAPREQLSEHAPQVLQTQILPEQIGLLIGKGGETIRGLQEEFGVQIDVEEDGAVRIYGVGPEAVAAKDQIEQMMRPVQVGDVFTERRVVKTADFGAFVELRKGTDGLLHVSRIAPGTRISSADQVLDRGDIVNVEVTEVDTDRGRIGLKLVAKIEDGVEVSPETVGERYKEQFPNGGGDDGDRGDRGDRGGRDRGRRRRSE
ncbi:MAG: polyribonucleotide nucleotidyltransferase [Actinomycetota bacterium]